MIKKLSDQIQLKERYKSSSLRICIICGLDFNLTNGKQKCCSKECSTINKKNYLKNYRINNIGYYKNYSKSYDKVYYIENKERILDRMSKSSKEHVKIRYKNNINFKLSDKLRNCIWRCLKSNKIGNSTKDFIDYTVQELREHLESLWLEGMSWENHSFYGWHIDHIRPLASFNFINEDGSINTKEVKKCMLLDNLQPLWAKDNLSKSNSYVGELKW